MLEFFEQYSKNEFQRIHSESQEVLKTNFINEMKYSYFGGGKRVRPQFIFTLGADLGVEARKLFPAAFALELIHTYSLVHDDLPCMDDDDFRRGKLSHHKKFGEAHAVLSGDGLLTLSFQVLAENYSAVVAQNLVLEFSRGSGVLGMVGGQVLDCLTHERSVETFHNIHHLKTSQLFALAAKIPGIVSDLGNDQIHVLGKIGLQIGSLFQLQDDLLDGDKLQERESENILSVVQLSELKDMIHQRYVEIKKMLDQLNLDEKSEFRKLVEKLYSREK